MGAKFDQAKGRVKGAVGDLTGNEGLKAKGRADRVGGEVKEKPDGAVDKAKEVVEDLKDKVTARFTRTRTDLVTNGSGPR